MDLSYFRHARRVGPSPQLTQLLARLAIAQSASPTACTVTTEASEACKAKLPTEIRPFIARQPRNAQSNASFNTGVAEALITTAQSL